MKIKHPFLKSVKLIQKGTPALFPMVLLSSLIDAAYPFINIILYAKLITDITKPEKDFDSLLRTAIILIVLNFLGKLLKNFIGQFQDVLQYAEMKVVIQSVADKSWKLDYKMLGDPDLNKRIASMNRWLYGHGILNIPGNLKSLISSLVSAGLSFSILSQLFLSKAEGQEKIVGFLNGWGFAAVFILWFLVALIFSMFSKRKSAEISMKSFELNRSDYKIENSIIWDCIWDYIPGKDIRLFKAADVVAKKLKEVTDRTNNLYIKYMLKSNALEGGGLLLKSIFYSLVIYILVAIKCYYGAFDVGNLFEYVSTVTLLSDAIISFFGTIAGMKGEKKYLEDYLDFYYMPESASTGTKHLTDEIKENFTLEVKDLTFTYPGLDTPTLKNISCTIKKGDKVAIVGRNGSGKSTFIKLLCRLYDPDSGVILLNGTDIREYDLSEYFSFFSTVFQDYCIYGLSIADNVAPVLNRDEEKVREALVNAGFGERLAELKDGTNTYIHQWFSPDGIELSGGESQKIAIARCLYKDAPFAIFDEPTSALDPVSEADIYERMNRFAGDKAAIFISHRLSSCVFCNKILVFNDGTKVQEGSHKELVKDEDALYYKLWHAQAQYYA